MWDLVLLRRIDVHKERFYSFVISFVQVLATYIYYIEALEEKY